MSQRQTLLNAIRSEPEDDLPRLIYADWLDEFGESDLDVATAEFIRYSCRGREGEKQKRITKQGVDWLSDNWKRLLPSVIRLSEPLIYEHPAKQAGSVIKTTLCYRQTYLPTRPDHITRACVFTFRRGFLQTGVVWHPPALKFLQPFLAADQPLAIFYDIDTEPRKQREYAAMEKREAAAIQAAIQTAAARIAAHLQRSDN